MKIKRLTCLILILLVLTPNFISSTAEEYLYEFSNNDEICEVIDYFYYDLKCPIIFNSDRLCTTVPVFYNCCSNEGCKTIIFDIQNREFLDDQKNSELIDLNYIKYNIHNGNLSLIQFDLSGFDICSFFGKKELKKESLNLATSAAEKISPLLEAERAKKIKDTITTARKIGKISSFNAVIFTASGTCVYDDRRLTEAITSISNCNTYLENINNNYAMEGYLLHFTEEVKITKYKLKEYLDLKTAKVRRAFNSVGNFIVGAWNFLKNLGSGENKEFEMKTSEYGYAKEAYSVISNYKPHLKNPENNAILMKHNVRVTEKIIEYNNQYETYEQLYGEIEDVKPNFLKILFSNLFFEPNYNVSLAKNYLEESKELKKGASFSIKEYKFNSAINQLSKGTEALNKSLNEYSRESGVDRRFSIF